MVCVVETDHRAPPQLARAEAHEVVAGPLARDVEPRGVRVHDRPLGGRGPDGRRAPGEADVEARARPGEHVAEAGVEVRVAFEAVPADPDAARPGRRRERGAGARRRHRGADAVVGVPGDVDVVGALGGADDARGHDAVPCAAREHLGAAARVLLDPVDHAAELLAVDVDEAALADRDVGGHGQLEVVLGATREVAARAVDAPAVDVGLVGVDERHVHAGSRLSSM